MEQRKAQRLEQQQAKHVQRVAHQAHKQARSVLRAEREQARRDRRISHTCPNCGDTFIGLPSVVYCGKRCRDLLGKHGRYPGLRSVPAPERNQVAEMIALVRAARRALADA
jgi:predicted RNA-binding Zn-ribbon protein involved in translation (DUF1610 family)